MTDLRLSGPQLESAISNGLISREQGQALLDLAKRPEKVKEPIIRDDEHFEFTNGFNDIFLAIGVTLLMVSLVSIGGIFGAAAGLLVCWHLSEILVLKQRAALPGIALAISFSFFASIFARLLFFQTVPGAWLGSLVAALVYYARFKLPFAVAIAAVSATAIALNLSWYIFGPMGSFRTPINFSSSVITIPAFIAGLVTFVAGMAFDMSDPKRQLRFSDCGFWLHLVAAPLIVHPAIAPLMAGSHATGPAGIRYVMILGIILLLGLLALAIDRRALLVASLAYLLAVIGYLLGSGMVVSTPIGAPVWMGVPLLLVGLLVLVLGMRWQYLRRRLLTPLSYFSIVKNLPPIQEPT